MRRVVVVPSAPVLLTEYAGLADPVPELRAAVRDAVAWLLEDASRVAVLTGAAVDNTSRGVAVPYSERLARQLLAEAGPGVGLGAVEPAIVEPAGAEALLVVADGSARRGEKAPGHFDQRSHDFDDAIGKALADADLAALRGVDEVVGAELLAAGVPALRELGSLVDHVSEARVDYEDDPFGVQYWVVRWQCRS